MKKTLLLLAAGLFLNATNAQDTVRLSVCTKFWKNAASITATTITGPGGVFSLDTTHNCVDFEVITSQYPPGATFAFSAGKPQDEPLNGVTVLDLIATSQHILGLNPLQAFGMLAADDNHSNTITAFDIVESRKLILGIYQNWPNAPIWRFYPDYSLPFFNPSNPFLGFGGSTSLTVSELQALNGGTIELIGVKTGDVDGDANIMHAFQGIGNDSVALKLPDIMLQAGVPVTIPVAIQLNGTVAGLQFEWTALPGTVAFEALTVDPSLSQYLNASIPSNSQMRVIYISPTLGNSPENLNMAVQLTSTVDIALKDALAIRQTNLPPLVAGNDNKAHKLFLDFSTSVGTLTPYQGLRVLSANPNPFDQQAQIQIALDRPETVLLEVTDVTGKLLFLEKTSLPAGRHQLTIPGALAPNGGLILYKITAGQSTATGKLFCEH